MDPAITASAAPPTLVLGAVAQQSDRFDVHRGSRLRRRDVDHEKDEANFVGHVHSPILIRPEARCVLSQEFADAFGRLNPSVIHPRQIGTFGEQHMRFRPHLEMKLSHNAPGLVSARVCLGRETGCPLSQFTDRYSTEERFDRQFPRT
jgi:hypothetical protein